MILVSSRRADEARSGWGGSSKAGVVSWEGVKVSQWTVFQRFGGLRLFSALCLAQGAENGVMS